MPESGYETLHRCVNSNITNNHIIGYITYLAIYSSILYITETKSYAACI